MRLSGGEGCDHTECDVSSLRCKPQSMFSAEDLVVMVRLDDGLLVKHRVVAGVDNLAIAAKHHVTVGIKRVP